MSELFSDSRIFTKLNIPHSEAAAKFLVKFHFKPFFSEMLLSALLSVVRLFDFYPPCAKSNLMQILSAQ